MPSSSSSNTGVVARVSAGGFEPQVDLAQLADGREDEEVEPHQGSCPIARYRTLATVSIVTREGPQAPKDPAFECGGDAGVT
jgi:hypothetical protein